MNIDIEKAKRAIQFFAQETDPKKLGKTKLLKLFYFADFLHVKRYGRPVIGDIYFHLPHGPIPTVIKNNLDQIEIEPTADNPFFDVIQINREKRSGYDQATIVLKQALKGNELKIFSESELEVLNEVAGRWKNANASELEKASHDEAPWRQTKDVERVDYLLAAEDSDCELPKAILKQSLESVGV